MKVSNFLLLSAVSVLAFSRGYHSKQIDESDATLDKTFRLPNDVIPSAYSVGFSFDLDRPNATHQAAKAVIHAEVVRSTDNVVLHSKGLLYDTAEIVVEQTPYTTRVTFNESQETATLWMPVKSKIYSSAKIRIRFFFVIHLMIVTGILIQGCRLVQGSNMPTLRSYIVHTMYLQWMF